MMKKKLSNRELDVMDVLWGSGLPLTASGIIQKETELSINTVQVVLKGLLKKSYIKVADIVYSGTVLSRAYEPTISKAEYISGQVIGDQSSNKEIIAALLKKETDINSMTELEQIIKERKRELKGE